MRTILTGLAILAAAVLVFGPELPARAGGNATSTGAAMVAPSPMAVDRVILRPDGGPYTVATAQSDCIYVGTQRQFELTCETGKCHYRMVQRQPDAGFPQVFPDAGMASPFDTPLPAEVPHLEMTTALLDSACVYFEAAGTSSISPLLQ